MSAPITVALDVMSGDAGCGVAIRAARRARRENANAKIILVGDEARIKRELMALGESVAPASAVADNSGDGGGGGDGAGNDGRVGWHIEHAGEVVKMDTPPRRAIRQRDTSMRRALELVREDTARVAVSAGNTGALMGLGVLVVGTVAGISRPAIASFIPNRRPEFSGCMLDLGANATCTAEMLRDFALMGTILVRVVKKIARPRVGLLNIGEEAHKGSDVLKEATALLERDERINFIGNVEGHEMYSDENAKADVIICDGFTGNVALKISEGLAKMMVNMLRDETRRGWLGRLLALLAYPLLMRLRKRFDHRQYNGACLVGLNKVVVKSHGNADEVAFVAAINTALKVAEQNLSGALAESIQAAPAADAASVKKASAKNGAKKAGGANGNNAAVSDGDDNDNAHNADNAADDAPVMKTKKAAVSTVSSASPAA